MRLNQSQNRRVRASWPGGRRVEQGKGRGKKGTQKTLNWQEKLGWEESKGVLPDERWEAIFKSSVFVLGHWE